MKINLHRRKFLGAAAATGVGCVGLSSTPAAAIEKIQRNGTAKFKFSLAAYSYRDLLTGTPPKLTLAEFVDDCAAMGLEGTELTSYYFPEDVDHQYLRRIKKQCFRLGLDISGTAVGNDFGYLPGDERDAEMANLMQWIENAEVLGAPVVRVFAGKQKKGVGDKRTHGLMVEGLEQACEHAGRHGVYLALENHGGPTATPEGLLRFVRDVRSPWFGVNLDTGNFFTDDPYGDLEKVAPYALNVQVKLVTARTEERIDKQPTDYNRVAAILRDAGYRGYVALEFEEEGDPREECPRHLAQIREAFV